MGILLSGSGNHAKAPPVHSRAKPGTLVGYNATRAGPGAAPGAGRGSGLYTSEYDNDNDNDNDNEKEGCAG